MSQPSVETLIPAMDANTAITMARNAIHVQVKILDAEFWEQYQIGETGSPNAAAFDIRACIPEPITLYPGQQALIGTGLALYIGDPNFTLLMMPRSGAGTKGLVLGNLTGVIDADYQGELKVCAWNRITPSNADNWADRGRYAEDNAITINPGDRIAQAFIVPVFRADMHIVDEFSDVTVRGVNGFGHSGVA